DLAFGSGAFTLEGWVTTTSSSGVLWTVGDDQSTALSRTQIAVSGAGLQAVFAGIGGGATVTTGGLNPPINNGQPHHVALVHDGLGRLTVYVDGTQVGTATGSLPAITSGNLVLGNSLFDFGNPFNGLIDDFRAYDVALSPQ